jgi:PAS domain S-box-containing protein
VKLWETVPVVMTLKRIIKTCGWLLAVGCLNLFGQPAPAGANPFSLPAQTIASLRPSPARAPLPQRVKVAGIVTACEAGKSFFLQDGDDALRVFPAANTTVRTGDRVEVVGNPTVSDHGGVLWNAVVHVRSAGTEPPPKALVQDALLAPELNNLWVHLDAEVIGDGETGPVMTLPLQIGNTIFKARFLSLPAGTQMPPRGSTVRLAGVYQLLTDDSRAPRAFQIIVPFLRNLEVTTRPSAWTIEHTMFVIGILVAIACLALLWVLLLRRKVSERTAVWQQSETKFRSLVEQSLVGVYVLQDGGFTYANPRMAAIYGYTVEELTSPAFNLRQTVADEDWPIVEDQIKRRMSGEITSAHYKLRAVRKDGSVINVEVMGSRAQYNGQPAILGTAMDITERTVAEAKLAEASNLLETLLENCPDYIYFKDRGSRFVRCSKAFEKLFHVTDVAALKGKTDFDFFEGKHACEAYADEQEIIRTGQPLIGKTETEVHPDGRVTSALTTKMPWRDNAGNIIGTFGISKDVSPLKDAEAKLAYERDLFHALLENFPDVIYFKDVDSRFVRVSRSKKASSLNVLVSRYRAEHPDASDEQLPEHLKSVEAFGQWLLGKTDFDIFPEERARAAFEDEKQIMRTGEPIVAKVEPTPQADGKITWCISTKMAWRDKEGKVIGTFGVSKDITALKQAEAELESAHQRIVETSRLAGMAEVASDVLHNVGNVLNSVNVSCSLTIDRVKTSKVSSLAKTAVLLNENRDRLGDFFTNDPRGKQIPSYLSVLSDHFSQEQSALLQELEQLLKHIEHIKQIVAMQQSYAKVAGVIETINPTQLVDDAIHINGAALTRHDVQVRCDFEAVPMIQTEKHRVLQILVNLIRNAKYALDEAKRPDKVLTVKLGRNGGDHIKIEVIDNGVGIPAENLTRIFGHGFTTRKSGHGFGLHSSAIAIKELGGSLTAHSDGTGKGARFVMLLPEAPPHAQETT